MKRTHSKWVKCEFCHMVHLQRKRHTCPEGAVIKRTIEIEEEVMEELEYFDLALEHFWSQPKTKFMEYLARRKDI